MAWRRLMAEREEARLAEAAAWRREVAQREEARNAAELDWRRRDADRAERAAEQNQRIAMLTLAALERLGSGRS
jgi:hypothetical protein